MTTTLLMHFYPIYLFEVDIFVRVTKARTLYFIIVHLAKMKFVHLPSKATDIRAHCK